MQLNNNVLPNQKARDILDTIKYATIATVSDDGQPWNSPVYYAYDENYTIYWASSTKSQHSQNIYANNKVFIAVYDSTIPWGIGKGVFLQAKGVEVSDVSEIAKACELRKARISAANQPPEDFMGDKPRRIYKALLQKVWTNEDGMVDGNFVDVRREAEEV